MSPRRTRHLSWTLGLVMLVGCQLWNSRRPTYQTIRPDPHRNPKAASRQNDKALHWLAKGRADKAEWHFQQALIEDVSFGPAHNNLGQLYYERGEYYLAAWEFEYAQKLMPLAPEPINNLGLVYEAADRLSDAITLYEQAQEIIPDHPEFKSNLARAKLKRGDPDDEIVELLEQVVWLDPRPDWRDWAEELLQTRYKDLHEPTRHIVSRLPAIDEISTDPSPSQDQPTRVFEFTIPPPAPPVDTPPADEEPGIVRPRLSPGLSRTPVDGPRLPPVTTEEVAPPAATQGSTRLLSPAPR